MTILNKTASASGERIQDLNIDLAHEIAKNNNKKAVEELVEGLDNKTKSTRHDCIKVLYEIASLKPSLISPHAAAFMLLLKEKDNRMQWGAMTALSAIAAEVPKKIFEVLPDILMIADQGSVITKDHAVKILVTLSGQKEYSRYAIPLLLEQILKAPNNQMPSYAEQALPVIDKEHKEPFRKILQERLSEIIPKSKQKRVEKILKKL